MTDDIYTKLKLTLTKYRDEFGKPHSFNDLYSFSKQYNHGLKTKEFIRAMHDMGVFSIVKRFDTGVLKRVLVYDMPQDRYITGEIAILKQCETCHGSGIVKADIPTITDTTVVK